MSGGNKFEGALPPFQLRPNKFVDRMMFVDLIQKVVNEKGAQKYSYISMGATFLHDHHTVYRRVGIENLFSFGRDENDIRRQEFNRPNNRMQCLQFDSSELHSRLDEIRGSQSVVIWLDFMSAGERKSQYEQTEEILRRLEAGDLLKITVNSEFRKFGRFDDQEKKKYESAQKMAAAKLQGKLSRYLPASLTSIKEADLPTVLARAFGSAAERALKHRTDVKIVPLLTTTYADGDRMLTVTCIVRPATEKKLPEALRGWKNRSKAWDDILEIEVPDLSMREKQFIDGRLKNSPARILSSLPFSPEDANESADLRKAIESYRLLHRYYPAFHHIDQ